MHSPGLRPGGQEPGRPWKFCLLFLGSSQGLDLVPTRAPPTFLSQQLAREEVIYQPSPSSTLSLGLRLESVGGQTSLPHMLPAPTHPGAQGLYPLPSIWFYSFCPMISVILLDGSVWLHCTREAQRGSVIPKGHTAVEQRGAES